MKHKDIEKVVEKLDSIARDVDPLEYGLPIYDIIWMQNAVRAVCEGLDIQTDDPRIDSIMNFTGCSRKVAIDLIESGEI